MTQLDLFGVAEASETEADRRFLAYHEANPHIYERFREVALSLRRRGWRRYGAKGVFEALRFHSEVAAVSESWKLNNDYTSRYARLLMANEPELAAFFQTRRLRA